MKKKKALSLADRVEWRQWLASNHSKEGEIWLVHYKKHTNKPGISYEDAVEEALCFGWIDSTLRKIDDEKFVLRYSPRKGNSLWSQKNKQRAIKMINAGKMTEAGLEKIEEAKKNGKWDSAYIIKEKPEIPDDLKKALMKNRIAWINFSNLANSYQFAYIYWVNSAKRKETREKRIKEVVERAAQNKKPGVD